jgi:hypothetical protein
MPAIKAPYKPLLWALAGALSLAPAVSSCGGDGEEQEDGADSQDAPVEDTAEPDPDDTAGDPEPDDSPGEEMEADAQDADEEELACPSFAEVQPIFTSSCASCHAGYDTYSFLTSHIDTVRTRVEGFHHIFGEDRSAVLLWIECGTPP